MQKKGITVREAAEKWVSEFSTFPYGMIQKLMEIDRYSWKEVTLPGVGDRVVISVLPETDADGNEYETSCREGEISEVRDEDIYLIELDDGAEILTDRDNLMVNRDDELPMWGTLWQFGDSCDDYWLEEKNGIQEMSDCGFRIYQHDEWGYFFGIDGCGYDFYEAHWIPAYKKRGLKWHDAETEVVA